MRLLRLVRDHRLRIAMLAILLVCVGYVVQVWIQVDKKLNAGLFSSSSNVYAAPRRISKGDKFSAAELVAELTESGYSASTANAMGYFKETGGGVEIHPGAQSYFRGEPALMKFAAPEVAGITMLDNGESVNEYLLEPRLIANVNGATREKRRLVSYSKIPPILVNAVLSAEDKKFFNHWGFNPLRILKALYVDVRAGSKEQGASTLTMQLARMLWLDQDKNWVRKSAEFLITIILESKLSKEQIFEYYANEIYLGEHRTYAIHGFGQGAHAYFNKDVKNLTLAEAAMLAGLIQRPSYLQPFQHPERAIARRNLVLTLMRQNQLISAGEWESASAEPLVLNSVPADHEDAPYFVTMAIDEIHARDQAPAENQPPVPRRIYTSLDLELQRIAVDAVQEGMLGVDHRLAQKFGKEANKWGPPQVALLALDPRTGEVKAAVGGRNYAASQLNHILSKRQPGSVFKPFVYTAAFQNRIRRQNSPVTQASTLQDSPHRFKFDGQRYEPHNFGDEYLGKVTLRRALAHSLNVATVLLAEEVGYSKVVALAKQAGLNEEILPTPSMALGAYETTPLEIAGAYTVFANRGIYTGPHFISSMRDMRTGALIADHPPEQHRVLDERVNFLMVDMLKEVINSGTAAGVRGMGLSAPAAGKTGTSRDGWFAGFTSELLVVVWVGFDDNQDLNLEGARSALPIWTAFMKRAVERPAYAPRELAIRPSGLVQQEIDAESGKVAGPACKLRFWAFFLQGEQPTEECHSEEDLPKVEPLETGSLTHVVAH